VILPEKVDFIDEYFTMHGHGEVAGYADADKLDSTANKAD
jgi:hypothetical protein